MERLQIITVQTLQKITSGCNVQSYQTTCYRNRSQQTKAWNESTDCIEPKYLNDHEPKRHRRYDGTHVNIASFINRFRLGRKTEHGINIIMKASLRAQITHYKALNDKISILTIRRHVHEANHGKSKFISCMEHQQQP